MEKIIANSEQSETRKPGETYVYTLWSITRELLYVGISQCFVTRVAQHFNEKPWADEIDHVGASLHSTREIAERIEEKFIRKHQPKYNKNAGTKHSTMIGFFSVGSLKEKKGGQQ